MATIKLHAATLPRLLSLLPKNGVSASVYQTRWEAKQLPVPSPHSSASLDGTCRWEVSRVNLGVSEEGKPWAKAFGVLYWKGKRVTPEGEVEKISGGSKYKWMSSVPPPALVKTIAPVATEASPEDATGTAQI